MAKINVDEVVEWQRYKIILESWLLIDIVPQLLIGVNEDSFWNRKTANAVRRAILHAL